MVVPNKGTGLQTKYSLPVNLKIKYKLNTHTYICLTKANMSTLRNNIKTLTDLIWKYVSNCAAESYCDRSIILGAGCSLCLCQDPCTCIMPLALCDIVMSRGKQINVYKGRQTSICSSIVCIVNTTTSLDQTKL